MRSPRVVTSTTPRVRLRPYARRKTLRKRRTAGSAEMGGRPLMEQLRSKRQLKLFEHALQNHPAGLIDPTDARRRAVRPTALDQEARIVERAEEVQYDGRGWPAQLPSLQRSGYLGFTPVEGRAVIAQLDTTDATETDLQTASTLFDEC